MLTTYTKLNKSASIFLGSNSKSTLESTSSGGGSHRGSLGGSTSDPCLARRKESGGDQMRGPAVVAQEEVQVTRGGWWKDHGVDLKVFKCIYPKCWMAIDVQVMPCLWSHRGVVLFMLWYVMPQSYWADSTLQIIMFAFFPNNCFYMLWNSVEGCFLKKVWNMFSWSIINLINNCEQVDTHHLRLSCQLLPLPCLLYCCCINCFLIWSHNTVCVKKLCL